MPEPKQSPDGPASAPAAEPETLSAILADFRKFALRAAEEDKMISPESVLLLADKAEAAAERERQDAMKTALLTKCKVCEKVGPASATGNAAAMREALTKARLYFDHRGEGTNLDDAGMAIDAITSIDAALAAPARNCDRFATAEEAYAAWQKHKSLTAICDWLFAPAKGDAK
jgi:hypothetical protein